MKLQYLGDSKDSFKWDYHDFLVSELNYPLFNIALMLTPDDKSNDGKSEPTDFPARKEILEFCQHLRKNRSIESIKMLPKMTGASYQIKLHKDSMYITNKNRYEYFSNIDGATNQLFFLDPDNGFEPEKSISEKHVSYNDIAKILEQISDNSVISVFQHHRRKSFENDFKDIKQNLRLENATAIYWNFLMFVLISKSKKIIEKVISINKKYAENKPVKIIS